MRFAFFTVLSLALAAACGTRSEPSSAPPVAPEFARLELPAKPPGAVGVADAKQAGPAESCAVTGRIASIVRGRAVFTLMDTSLPYCGEKNKADRCKTPWDYCCESASTRTAHSLVVEVRDARDQPSVGSLGDLRLLDVVTVTGRLARDEHGNSVLIANGWHRDARPELPGDLRWPN